MAPSTTVKVLLGSTRSLTLSGATQVNGRRLSAHARYTVTTGGAGLWLRSPRHSGVHAARLAIHGGVLTVAGVGTDPRLPRRAGPDAGRRRDPGHQRPGRRRVHPRRDQRRGVRVLAGGRAAGPGGGVAQLCADVARRQRRRRVQRLPRLALAGLRGRRRRDTGHQRRRGRDERTGGRLRRQARRHLLLRQLGGPHRGHPVRVPRRRSRALAARRARPLRRRAAAPLEPVDDLRPGRGASVRPGQWGVRGHRGAHARRVPAHRVGRGARQRRQHARERPRARRAARFGLPSTWVYFSVRADGKTRAEPDRSSQPTPTTTTTPAAPTPQPSGGVGAP